MVGQYQLTQGANNATSTCSHLHNLYTWSSTCRFLHVHLPLPALYIRHVAADQLLQPPDHLPLTISPSRAAHPACKTSQPDAAVVRRMTGTTAQEHASTVATVCGVVVCCCSCNKVMFGQSTGRAALSLSESASTATHIPSQAMLHYVVDVLHHA